MGMMEGEIQFKNVFITVGTTQFHSLINAVFDCLKLLKERFHMKRVFIQIGTMNLVDIDELVINQHHLQSIDDELKNGNVYEFDEETFIFRFTKNFQEYIKNSDLIISHCGSGSILESLSLKKHSTPLIVVVNDELMDNHQAELANQMGIDLKFSEKKCENKYFIKTSPNELKNVFFSLPSSNILGNLKVYHSPLYPTVFHHFIDELHSNI
ncbi:hypothetical protein SNEBB_011208 [Seison nebaliae]|nr:hypothetical protein SNEBB_011208 [Seison nebaliae]